MRISSELRIDLKPCKLPNWIQFGAKMLFGILYSSTYAIAIFFMSVLSTTRARRSFISTCRISPSIYLLCVLCSQFLGWKSFITNLLAGNTACPAPMRACALIYRPGRDSV
jgi:hypothetical protein